MDKRDYEIARMLKKRLAKFAKVTDYRLFGSRAKGTADKYSDMDIFIEVEKLSQKIKKQISESVWEVGFENYLVISPLIFSMKEARKSPMKSSQILKNIKEEGIRV